MEPPARPRAIVKIAEMPMTPVGKIFKPRLREIAAEDAAREALAAALPGAGVRRRRRPRRQRARRQRARRPGRAEAAREALGRFPVRFEVVAADGAALRLEPPRRAVAPSPAGSKSVRHEGGHAPGAEG